MSDEFRTTRPPQPIDMAAAAPPTPPGGGGGGPVAAAGGGGPPDPPYIPPRDSTQQPVELTDEQRQDLEDFIDAATEILDKTATAAKQGITDGTGVAGGVASVAGKKMGQWASEISQKNDALEQGGPDTGWSK